MKGIYDPSKSKKAKKWLRQKGHFDVVVLTEVKCVGEALKQRLNTIYSLLTWIVSAHRQGAGEVALGKEWVFEGPFIVAVKGSGLSLPRGIFWVGKRF